MKISVVMASYLGDYPNCATNRIEKFHRAINSFLNQNYPDKELIIVSDGCPITIKESLKYLEKVKIFALDKQSIFSGNVRNLGLKKATGDIICYLDTDDFLGVNHLSSIVRGFKEDEDWVFFDDKVIHNFNPTNNEILTLDVRNTLLQKGSIGVSAIAHKNLLDFNWEGCDGYGHDWNFINKLIILNKKFKKIYGCEYYVCHIPNSVNV